MSGFITHKWFKLLSEDGIPVSGASVYLYEYTGSTPTSADYLHRTDMNGLTDTTSPLITSADGSFQFYVKDHIKAQEDAQSGGIKYGYHWDTKYVISWSKNDLGGIIFGDNLFGEYESVVVSASDNISMNKTISNNIGRVLQNHIDSKCGV